MNETNVHQMPGCDTVFDLLSWLSGGGVQLWKELVNGADVVNPQVVGCWLEFGPFSWLHSNTGAMMPLESDINVRVGFPTPSL